MAVAAVRIGTSGWSYDSWRGRVYPTALPRAEWLSFYATLFDSVEINSSFYRLPSAETVARWRTQVPSGFVMSAKVGGGLTHRRRLIDASASLSRHIERFRPLESAWGPNLLQLPPRWRVNAERLDTALASVTGVGRWAVEIRDPSWFVDDVYAVLRQRHAALVVHDLVSVDHPRLLTADWAYVRLHGPGGPSAPYVGRYGTRRLSKWAEWIEHLATSVSDVYVYFDNDVDAAAVYDATWLRQRLGV